MMSKKHFVRMADFFSEAMLKATPEGKVWLAETAREFADMSRADNSNFNRQKFYYACGLDSEGRAK